MSGRVKRTQNIIQVNFSLTRQKGRAPGSMRIRSAVLAPAHAPPSAAPAGSIRRLYNCENPSAEVPAAYPPSSAAPGPALSRLSAAFPGPAFAPPFSTGSGLAHTRASTLKTFRAQIMPRNALACARLSPGPPTRLIKTHALATCAFCLFCLHYIKCSKIFLFC